MTKRIETSGGIRRAMQRDTEILRDFYTMILEDEGTVDDYWDSVIDSLMESRFYETPEEQDEVEMPFPEVRQVLEGSGFIDPEADLTLGRGDQIPIWGAGRRVLNATAEDIAQRFSGMDYSVQQNSGRRETYSSRNPLHRNALRPRVLGEGLEEFELAESPPDGTSLDEVEVMDDDARRFREALQLDPGYTEKSLPDFYRELEEDLGFRNSGDITEASNNLLPLLFDAEIYPEALKAKVGDVEPGEGIPAELGSGRPASTTYLSLDDSGKAYRTEYDGEEVSMTIEEAEEFAWLGGPGNYAITLPAATLSGFLWLQPKGIDPGDSLYAPLTELEKRTGEKPWPWAGLGYYGSGDSVPEAYACRVSQGWPGKDGEWDPSERGIGQKVSVLCSMPYAEFSRIDSGGFDTAERAETYFSSLVESGIEEADLP